MLIASKYEELFPPEISEFIYLTDNTYDKDQVIAMEKHILKKLKFELSGPLPIHFLRRYSKAAESDDVTHNMSKYFIELAACEYEFCQYKPSEIAAASIFIAMCIQSKQTKSLEQLWTSTLEYYSTYSLKDLLPIIQKCAKNLLSVPKAKLNQVYRKYSSQKLKSVAQIVEKSEDILMNLSNIC